MIDLSPLVRSRPERVKASFDIPIAERMAKLAELHHISVAEIVYLASLKGLPKLEVDAYKTERQKKQ